jgi:hypothetical protein
MQSLLAKNAETEDRKVRLLCYKDTRSALGKSAVDMALGRTHKVVGCRGTQLNECTEDDFVLVVADTPTGRKFHVGLLKKRTTECRIWSDHGGEVWTHNWEYDPCTPDMDVKEKQSALREAGFAPDDVQKMFQRCGDYALPILARAFREGIFPVST